MEVPYEQGHRSRLPYSQRPGPAAAPAPRAPPPVPPPLLAKRHFRRPRLRERAPSPECGTTCEHGDQGEGGVCESSCKTPAAATVSGSSGLSASLGGPHDIKWDTCPGFRESASPPFSGPDRFLETREEQIPIIIGGVCMTRDRGICMDKVDSLVCTR
eukprot:XP_022273787.1 uncharacterized protein LOC111095772 isoform X4 [Canis lupus familiaris]